MTGFDLTAAHAAAAEAISGRNHYPEHPPCLDCVRDARKAVDAALPFLRDDPAELSRLLFEAREQIDMWGDVVAARTREDPYVRDVRDRIDAYRAARGWPANGYGGET